MTDEQRNVIIPVEQINVPFYGYEIVAVRLPDGRIGAVFNNLCDAIRLERKSQTDRVREDDVLGEQLVLAQVMTSGGPQAMNVLTAWAIPTWLQGIQIKRVAAEKREAILAFKREAADVLYRHFSQQHPALPAPAAIVPPQSLPQPEKPAPDAMRTTWIEYYQQMAAWLQWQEDVELWRQHVTERQDSLEQKQEELEGRQDSMESRMEGVEELARMSASDVSRLLVVVNERLGPQTLTSEHQATVKSMVTRLHEVSGFGYATIYSDLNSAFHVARYSDIPDDRWPEVAAWLTARIEAAERKRRHPGE